MICDDLSAELSEWIKQIDLYLSECTIYDESVREHLTAVRGAMGELREHLEMGDLREYLDSM